MHIVIVESKDVTDQRYFFLLIPSSGESEGKYIRINAFDIDGAEREAEKIVGNLIPEVKIRSVEFRWDGTCCLWKSQNELISEV